MTKYTIVDPVVGQVTFESTDLIGGKISSKVFDASVTKPINGVNSYCIKLYSSREGITLKPEAFQKFQNSGVRVVRVISTGTFSSETPYYRINYNYQIMEKYNRVLHPQQPETPALLKRLMFDISETMTRLREMGLMHTDVTYSNIATNDDKTFFLLDTDKIDLYDENIFKENFVTKTLWMIRPRTSGSIFDLISPFVSSPESLVEFLLSPNVFLTSLVTRKPDESHPRYSFLKEIQGNTLRNCFNDPTGRSSVNPVDKLMTEKFVGEIMSQLPNIDVDRILNRAPSGCYVNKEYLNISNFQ